MISIEHLREQMAHARAARRKRVIVVGTEEHAEMVKEAIGQQVLGHLFEVTLNPHVPKDTIFIVPKMPELLERARPSEYLRSGRIIKITGVNTEEEEMGIVKHGEGEILPENEQQKIAQAQEGMDRQARAELDRENAEADGGDPDSAAGH